MAKVIDVLIFFEHENRDLESALLLEYELKKRGLSVECVQVGWTAPIAPLFYKPKLIIANSIYDDKTMHRFYDYQGGLEGNRFILVNYHCEQIVTNAALGFSSCFGRAKDTFHLAWGNYFKEVLLKNGIPDELIRITGSPRLDFFQESFRAFNPSKEKLALTYGLDANAKWIMVMGNFSGAFLTDAQINDYVERGNLTCKEECELTKESLEVFIKWVNDIASNVDGKGVEVIYRPHPAEPETKESIALEKKYSHFHVIRERPIREWIVNSDLCLTWTSTSAVEAAVAGVPVYSLRPFPIPEAMQIPLLEHVPALVSAAEVMAVVDGFLQGESLDDEGRFLEWISPYYYAINQKTAVQCTADLIEEALSNGKRALYDSHFSFLYSARKLMNYYLKIVMQRVGLLKILPRYELIPKDRTTKKTMENMRKKIKLFFE